MKIDEKCDNCHFDWNECFAHQECKEILEKELQHSQESVTSFDIFKKPFIDVYTLRKKGREYCFTDGTDHYKKGNIEPIDLTISKGMIEDFCLGNIIKYASRFKQTENLTDLKKVSDYAHILCGAKLNGM